MPKSQQILGVLFRVKVCKRAFQKLPNVVTLMVTNATKARHEMDPLS